MPNYTWQTLKKMPRGLVVRLGAQNNPGVVGACSVQHDKRILPYHFESYQIFPNE